MAVPRSPRPRNAYGPIEQQRDRYKREIERLQAELEKLRADDDDEDVRTVAALLNAQAAGASMAECKHAFAELRARFADRMADLATRDERDEDEPTACPDCGHWIASHYVGDARTGCGVCRCPHSQTDLAAQDKREAGR